MFWWMEIVFTRGRVDRALDAVAGKASGRLFGSDFGTLTCYGLLGSDEIFNAAQFIFEMCVQGFSPFIVGETTSVVYRASFACQKEGLFETPILKTFAFEDICEAVELAEKSGGQGKVLLIGQSKRQLNKNILSNEMGIAPWC